MENKKHIDRLINKYCAYESQHAFLVTSREGKDQKRIYKIEKQIFELKKRLFVHKQEMDILYPDNKFIFDQMYFISWPDVDPKEEHNCNDPEDLYNWCLKQAAERYEVVLTEEKFQKLESLQFPWAYYENELDKFGYFWKKNNPNGVRYPQE